MEIVQIAAELAPVAKVGGLADVLLALSKALQAKKEQVEIVLPRYDCLDVTEVEDLNLLPGSFTTFFDGHYHQNSLWKGRVHGVNITFIEPDDPWGFFERNTVYGSPDDTERFLYFCKAAIDYLYCRERLPEIVHVHDWHLSALPALLKTQEEKKVPKIVLTIHNHTYQGITSAATLYKAGFKKELFPPRDHYNLLEEGIRYADYITTVSPTYAQEILGPSGGDLSALLREAKKKGAFEGILNGIDLDVWNPKKDSFLPIHYDKEHKSGKKEIQKMVRKMFSLEESNGPLVSSITRLVYQKSPELIKEGLLWTLKAKGQFILLGSSADSATHEAFYALKRTLSSNRGCHIELAFNERLSHLVYAASDILLVPSRFEPCGLTQLYAMRYGTLPLVHKTGGLADTVIDNENGFTFETATKEAEIGAFERAFHIYRELPEKWRTMQDRAMRSDFSWDNPAMRYSVIYRQLVPSSPLLS